MCGILKDIISSFYSSRFYYDVAHNRKGIGFGHMFLLALIIFLLMSPWKWYRMEEDAMHIISTQMNVDDWPDFAIKDHKLSINKPSPYTITLGEGKEKLTVVIDTGYKISDVDALKKHMIDNNILGLITEESMATLKGKDMNEVDITKFDQIKDATFTHENAKVIFDKIYKWGVLISAITIVIVAIPLLMVFNLIVSYLSAVIVKIGSLLGKGLDYEACVRLVAAFRIPVYLVCAVPVLVDKPQIGGSASWLIWFLYLAFSVYASIEKRDNAAS